jgi:hypothetical protein
VFRHKATEVGSQFEDLYEPRGIRGLQGHTYVFLPVWGSGQAIGQKRFLALVDVIRTVLFSGV